MSLYAWFRFVLAYGRALGALRELNRMAQRTGCLGVEIQAGIAENMLQHEYKADAEIWSRRKLFGVYSKRGVPAPLECLEAELRHAERMAKAGAR